MFDVRCSTFNVRCSSFLNPEPRTQNPDPRTPSILRHPEETFLKFRPILVARHEKTGQLVNIVEQARIGIDAGLMQGLDDIRRPLHVPGRGTGPPSALPIPEVRDSEQRQR